MPLPRRLVNGSTAFTLALCLLAALLPGCAGTAPTTRDPVADFIPSRPADAESAAAPLEQMGYTVQVGAFSELDNAVRLERLLNARGIEAFYFRHDSGLYKVCFGNHASYAPARTQAEQLQRQGLIDSFFIVFPENHAAARIVQSGSGDLRVELVRTASEFIGTPYRWGGEDADNGFDCSGLTMVAYRLNGLNLPRNSRSQFAAGRQVDKRDLRQGDLVFFATKGGTRVTHVGMYIGDGKFIHAPRTGQTVRIERLSSGFFARTYVGGRSYL